MMYNDSTKSTRKIGLQFVSKITEEFVDHTGFFRFLMNLKLVKNLIFKKANDFFKISNFKD